MCVLKAELRDSAVGVCEARDSNDGGFGFAEREDGVAANHREDSGSSSVGELSFAQVMPWVPTTHLRRDVR